MQISGNKSKYQLARHGSRRGVSSVIIIALVAMGMIAACWVVLSRGSNSEAAPSDKANASAALEASSSVDSTNRKFAVTVRKPMGPPRVFTGTSDAKGNPITVSCSICHTTRQPNFANKTAGDLNEFHSQMEFAHGAISCLSCHNAKDYDALKLADETRIEYSEVMTLCAQCHGPQMRAFQHDAHGGMNGHWDLSRGPQTKNNCVDCHNPHTPKFPKMKPTFKPKDRFLEKPRH